MRWPGLLLVAVLSASAWGIARGTGEWGIGASAIGILLGWLVGRGRLPATFSSGTAWMAKAGLLFAITLLGFTLDAQSVLDAGGRVLGLGVVVIVTAMVAAQLLGRAFGVAPGMRTLLGVGTGVCGVSAMAAAQTPAGADDNDLTLAATIITALGALGLIGLPAILLWQPILGPAAFGAWAGASLQAVPHAVGAGLAGGGTVGAEWATLVKLTRVAMLAGVMVYLVSRARSGNRREPMALEVKLFLGALVLGNIMPWPAGWMDVATLAAKTLLLAALVALALQTRLSHIREAGRGPWLVGIGSWIAVLAVALAMVRNWT